MPVGSTVWKSDLLDGVINPDVTDVLGRTLAQWHNFGEKDKEARLQFMEDSLFEQLRVDPFYRFVAAKNENLKPVISKLISELEGDKTTIVHGDFSPKNIMVGMDEKVYILDFEVTHVGNPVFDLAFLLAHLLCKLFRTNEPLEEKMLIASAQRFVSAYEEIRPISNSLSLHTALIALARVEGKSPVNYLDKAQQDKLVKYTKGILSPDIHISINQLFEKSTIL